LLLSFSDGGEWDDVFLLMISLTKEEIDGQARGM